MPTTFQYDTMLILVSLSVFAIKFQPLDAVNIAEVPPFFYDLFLGRIRLFKKIDTKLPLILDLGAFLPDLVVVFFYKILSRSS